MTREVAYCQACRDEGGRVDLTHRVGACHQAGVWMCPAHRDRLSGQPTTVTDEDRLVGTIRVLVGESVFENADATIHGGMLWLEFESPDLDGIAIPLAALGAPSQPECLCEDYRERFDARMEIIEALDPSPIPVSDWHPEATEIVDALSPGQPVTVTDEMVEAAERVLRRTWHAPIPDTAHVGEVARLALEAALGLGEETRG